MTVAGSEEDADLVGRLSRRERELRSQFSYGSKCRTESLHTWSCLSLLARRLQN